MVNKNISTKSEYDVFISYNSSDMEFANELKEALAKEGLKVWMDDKIGGGDPVIEKIEDGLKKSKAMVLIVSPESNVAPWVQTEYQVAFHNYMNKNHSNPQLIIPIIIREAEIPMMLRKFNNMDFQDTEKFEENIRNLVKSINQIEDVKDYLQDESLPNLDETIFHSLTLDEIMLQTKKSLIVSGHTLDKFSLDPKVKSALIELFNRGVSVKLILLNPHSSYSRAHEPFHSNESKCNASDQIYNTINFFKNMLTIFGDFNKSSKFEVLLSNYMPRFRTILVDDDLSYINLYMYGKDVGKNPEFILSKKMGEPFSSWFETISSSTKQLINSNDVIHLIKNGKFNEDWENTKVTYFMDNCLKKNCCRIDNCWNLVEDVILGYQNEMPQMAYEMELCDKSYKPGLFTLADIEPTNEYLKSSKYFSEWIDEVLDEELELIENTDKNLFFKNSRQHVAQKVKESLEFAPREGESLLNKIWYQEYSDIIRRLIFSICSNNPDLNLNTYPNLTVDREDFIFKVIETSEKMKKPTLEDWLQLSVAAGLLGIDEKSVHAATSEVDSSAGIKLNESDDIEEVYRVVDEMWYAAKSECRVDATNAFIHRIENNCRDFKLVSFPDDYLESIVLLKFYEELLKKYPNLSIYFVPRSNRCSNDINYDDTLNIIKKFEYLNKSDRFHIQDNGPKIGGVNLLKLHPDIMKLIQDATALDVRGARNYEMMQGVKKEIYFGFMVCREFSESITGFPIDQRPFVYLRHNIGEHSFEGFKLRHQREQNGIMYANVTVNDQKEKWNGGCLATFNELPREQKERHKLLRDFYCKKAPDFNSKFGDNLEPEVKEFLKEFSKKVLVIGCGSGKEVNYLSKANCETWGIDFSSEAINLAKRAYPDLKDRFIVEDMYNLDIVGGTFNGIIANAVLLHLLDRNDIHIILKKIYKKLEKDGLCFIRLIEKEDMDQEIDRNLFGNIRWFVYYNEEELKDIIEDNGFIIEKMNKTRHIKYDQVYWVSVLLRKTNLNKLKI